MKRILFNLLGLAVIATVFSACNPMNKTYEAIGPVPTPQGTPQTFSVTLTAADYALLPAGNYAKTSLSFKSKDDAAAGIPAILASKYPNYANKSSASVTYAFAPATIKVADSLFIDVAYTLTDDDYRLLPGNTFTDFSASQILKWLPYKYPDPAVNQLALLTFTYYESGVQSTQTQSFLFLNSVWKKIYTISAAQYGSIGKGGTFNNFSSSDAANLSGYFNTFLKADPAVSSLAKFGDIQYVSFKYFAGGNYQRVLPLTFDGTNWATASTPQTLAFGKAGGAWVADNTVTYSLVSADYTTIANIAGVASADAIDNLKAHGNFSLTGATAWTDAQIAAGIAVVLKAKYPAAVANQKFVVTYSAYNGASISVTKTFQFDGTTFKVI